MQETVVLLCSLIISATVGGMTGWFAVEPFADVKKHYEISEIFNV